MLIPSLHPPRFYPRPRTEEEREQLAITIETSIRTNGPRFDSTVARDTFYTLMRMDAFSRAMREACERFLKSEPVDPGEDGNG